MPISFRLARFRFTVCAKDHIRFPAYKGAVFRGGFGYAFKKIVCVVKGKPCDNCMLKQKCIYAYIFETPPPEDAAMLRLYPKVPHPFVIEPPADEKLLYTPGESFPFNLILIGRAIEYLPYFIYTFTELGKQGVGKGRGKYDLTLVEGTGIDDESVPIYNGQDQILTNQFPVIDSRQLQHHNGSSDNDTLHISLKTPVRLRFNGHITDILEFHVLVRNLLRRISSLSYFHCEERLEVDFKGLIEKASTIRQIHSDLHWYDWNRYSTRQEQWMSLGGVLGTVTYEGNNSEFIPFLKLGEFIHIGKGTSFGLGRYEIMKSSNK